MRSRVLIIPVAITVKYSTGMFVSETVFEIYISYCIKDEIQSRVPTSVPGS
jgi:hypothetical protein